MFAPPPQPQSSTLASRVSSKKRSPHRATGLCPRFIMATMIFPPSPTGFLVFSKNDILSHLRFHTFRIGQREGCFQHGAFPHHPAVSPQEFQIFCARPFAVQRKARQLHEKCFDLSEESVIRIARVFNVSTDFILGTTVIPDKKNYDISELGLSVEAAKNLYTGKVNNDVVNRLLENPRFAMVTYMIAQYMDDTLARGYAAQNQMFATVGSLLLGQNQAPEAVQAARTANAMKIPAYQADQTTIHNTFMTVVKEIKKEAGSDLVAAKAISKEATEKMFAELTKGQDMQNPTITPEAVVDAITGSISGVDGVNQEALDNFNKALLGLMQTMVLPEDDGQDN